MELTDNDKLRFWAKVQKSGNDNCWNWTGACKLSGHGQLMMHSIRRPIGAHRISWLIHQGKIKAGLCICHHCDNPRCVNPRHLFVGSQLANIADMNSKGRHGGPRGPEHPHAVLNYELAAEAKKLLIAGESCRSIGRELGVSHTAISRIKRGITWR